MKTYTVYIRVLDDTKMHIVTAESREQVKELVEEFWRFTDDLEIRDIYESIGSGVLITKEM
jgi:hypothetical protein